MTFISRTRSGCRTCRSRRIKCDEQRPVCRHCLKSNLDCSYGLRLVWHEESLSKGVCHGRSGVWSKKCPLGRSSSQQQRLQRLASKSGNGSSGRANTHSRGIKNYGGAMFLNTTERDVKIYLKYEGLIEEDEEEEHEDRLDVRPHCSKPDVINRRMKRFPDAERPRTKMNALTLPISSTLGALQTLDYDANNNPYRHLILPMAMQSEGLYHATLAVSAQILGIAEPKYRFAALNHGHHALKYLIATLQRGSWSSAEIDEILGLAVMLCWYEITDGCRPSWVMHLNGIHALINRYPELFKRGTSSLYRFFNRYFSFHVVLARTAFRVEDDLSLSNLSNAGSESDSSGLAVLHNTLCDSSSAYHDDGETTYMKQKQSKYSFSEQKNTENYSPFSESTDFLSLTMSLEDLNQIDSYMGFSNSLLLLINEIADLAWKYPSKAEVDSDLNAVRSKVQRLRHSLSNLRQTPPPLSTSDINIEENHPHHGNQYDLYMCTVSEFEAIAEANRLGALLLLHEVCSSRLQRPDIFITEANPPLPSSSYTKSDCVRRILDIMLKNINRFNRTAALPLWPLFLAGCCATTEEDRIMVMRIFEETEKPKRFGNITPAREVVEMIWRQRDLGVQDDRKRRQSAAVRRYEAGKSMNCKYQSPGISPMCQSLYSRTAARRCTEMFEWERAMSMMGGLKLSLT